MLHVQTSPALYGQTVPFLGSLLALGNLNPLLFLTKCKMQLLPLVLSKKDWFGMKKGFQFALSPNILRVVMTSTFPFCLPAADTPSLAGKLSNLPTLPGISPQGH